MKRLLLFLVLIVVPFLIFSQTFRGRITSENGDSIPFAALYLREISSGFVSDDNGYFQTTVPLGKYTCEISSLGYNKKTLPINVPTEGLTMNIVLTEHTYQLKEVEITLKDEDPAYAVMRNTIASAPKNRYRVATYTADTYLKGSGKATSIPSLLMMSKEVREATDKYLNRTFLLEEQRKVTYTAPNKWDNEVIAYSNTFPDGFSMIIETTDVNLYTPKLFGKISPLSAGAFNYYNYKLEGLVAEGNYLINKVKVIPKKDNPELIGGYLYIVEDLWCVSGLDLILDGTGMSSKVKVSCNEVEPALFLTTSISIENSFNAFGLEAQANFLSSIKYLNVEVAAPNQITPLNSGTVQPQSVLSQLTPSQQKTLDKINKLQAKEHLTTREAYKLSRLYEKSIRQSDTTRSRYKYERRPRSYNLKTDSMANKRDSAYWNAVRSVPLNDEERESYAYKRVLDEDSIPQDSSKSSFGGRLLETFLVGKTYRTNNKKTWIEFKSFPSMIPEYNFVDGLWVGATFSAGHKFSDNAILQFTPRAYYTTARKEWTGSGLLSLDYAPRRLGKLWLEAGTTSADFNRTDGENRLINSVASLIFGKSDMRFYKSNYLTVGNQLELTNSLLFTAVLDWERRQSLDNNTTFSLFGKKDKSNIPANPQYLPMQTNNLLKTTFSLSYTPEHYYRMIRGKKYYDNSSYPTFGLLYQQAYKHGASSKLTPSYKRMELSAEQNIQFGMFNNLYWYVNGGLIWDAEDMQFPDFKHFATTRIPVTARMLNKGFSLLDNYESSTNTRWVQANVMWSTPYLLIKHLPFLRRKLFDEALHLRSLIIYDKKPYTELGYSVGVMDMARLGLFVGFDRLKYNTIGISVSLNIFTDEVSF